MLKVGRAVGPGPRADSTESPAFLPRAYYLVRLISLGIKLARSRYSPFGSELIHLLVELNGLGTAGPQETHLQKPLPQTSCLEASGPRRLLVSWEKFFCSFCYLASDLIKL